MPHISDENDEERFSRRPAAFNGRRRAGGRAHAAARRLVSAAGPAALVAVFLIACLAAPAQAQESKKYETRYATIYYSSDEEFYGFASDIGSLGIFGRSTGKAFVQTRERVDAIVDRVENILDMHPDGLRFNVYIHATEKGLQETYRDMGIYGAAPIAFYSHRTRSVYVSLENLTEGVFAHELAHAVINFYFVTPPPARMQEILARYVDRNLWQK